MKNVMLSLLLLLTSSRFSAAQKAQPQPDKPEQKLPAILAAKSLKEDAKDDDLRKLLKARYNTAVSEVQEHYERYKEGQVTLAVFAGSGQRLLRSGLELTDKPEEKVALLTQYVELTREIERIAQQRQEVGAAPMRELHQARYQRLDAEIQLLRAKRAAEKSKTP